MLEGAHGFLLNRTLRLRQPRSDSLPGIFKLADKLSALQARNAPPKNRKQTEAESFGAGYRHPYEISSEDACFGTDSVYVPSYVDGG